MEPTNPQIKGTRFEDVDGGSYRTLHRYTSDSKYPKAYVEYKVSPKDKTVKVAYLKSHYEGEGHARATMSHLYSLYPDHTISWGKTLNSASRHLASSFSSTHGRTRFY